MKHLEVFKDVPIPLDLAATSKFVTLGASDSGKTFMLARLAEQLAKAGAFFVLIDPVGKHWSLRAGPDGKPDGGIKDIWVLGGQHGDVPLDPASGALIADTVVDHPGRYVIDTSNFETDQDVYNFATAFAKRLFRRKMRDAGWPLLLMLEESETFLPQVAQEGQKHMKGAFGRIVRQGRNHGIGVFLVFQRSAAGDKGAMSQCKVLIAKRSSHKRDREAIEEWVKSNGTEEQRDELMAHIASLGVEEAYVWDPSWLRVFKRTTVLPRETFDSSSNVKHGEKMAKVELVPLDVQELGEKMRSVAEKAVDDDPKRLRDKIAKLESDLARDQGALEDVAAAEEAVQQAQERIAELEAQVVELERRPAEPTMVYHPVLDGEAEQLISTLSDDIGALQAELREVLEKYRDPGAGAGVDVFADAASAAPGPPPPPTPGVERIAQPPQPAQPSQPSKASTNGELTKAQLELVEAHVALFPRAASFEQLGIMLAKSYNAGPFRGAIAAIKEMGYVDEAGRATEAARKLVGPRKLPTPEEMQQRWLARLTGTKLKIFETALNAYPRTMPPDEIGAAIGKNPNAGPIRGMMNDLAAWQLVSYDKDAGIRVSDYLIDLTGGGAR